MSRQTILAVALCCGLARTSAADKIIDGAPMQNGIGIEVGVIAQTGMSEFGDDYANLAPEAQGIVLRDRNGMTSRMVIGLLIAVAGAMAASGPKSVESRTYQSGNYMITETKTTYYSEAEKAQMREDTNKAIDGLFAARHSDFELHLYSRDRFNRGDTSGFKLNFFIGSGDGKTGWETGVGGGRATSIVSDKNMVPTLVRYKYLGMPFRVTRVIGPVRASLTYEWNWLKYGLSDEERHVHPGASSDPAVPAMQEVSTGSHPWKLDISTMIMKRVALTGGITAQTLAPELGYYASAGIFF